jgi:hypothetical protein
MSLLLYGGSRMDHLPLLEARVEYAICSDGRRWWTRRASGASCGVRESGRRARWTGCC